MLRYTLLGKQMRALSDDLDLAETSGIDTSRVILYTWLFAGGLAGLAGVLAGVDDAAPAGDGIPAPAADLRGGGRSAASATPSAPSPAGIVLGLVIEWSTMFIDARWKVAVGFVVLILVLIIRPQGIFGKAKAI